MKTSSVTTSLLLALLLIAPAAAEIDTVLFSHEAEFNAPTDITKVCGCGQTTDAFDLTNRGDFPAGFAIALESEEDWISVPAEFLYLEPGENTTVAVLLDPSCDERGEETRYTVYATSEFGRFRAADRTVDVLACQPIGLEIEPDHRTVLPCSPAEFAITLTNTASYEETYTIIINPEGLEERVRQVTLAPEETFEDTISVQWPCGDSGLKDILVTVVAERTGVEQKAIATVDILSDYSFQAELVQESVCAEIATTTALRVTNTAGIENTYTVLSETPYATIERDQVTIPAGATVEIPITLQPTEAEVGQQTVSMSVTGEYGEATVVATAPIEVRDCYEHRVTVTPASVTACAGPQNLTIRIDNRGEESERFTLHTAGDIFSEVARDTLRLRSGEHANVLLQALIPDRTNDYRILLEVNQTPGVESTTVIPVQAVSNADCTLITPATTEIDIYTDDVVVPLLVENHGVRASTYIIEYDGRVLAPDEEELYLAPGEQAIIHLRLTTENTGTYIETLRLVSDRAEYRYDLAVDIDEKSVFTRAYEALTFSQQKWSLWGVILLSLLVVVMVAALILLRIGAVNNPKLKDSTRYAWTVILLGLAAILIVVGVYQALTVPAPAITEDAMGDLPSELYYEVAQGGETVIDLSQYFEDPEGDPLSYRATQPENLMVRIEGDDAVIRPARGFSGIERVAFTAVDPDGATADSPIMTVRVLRTEPRTFGAWLGLYGGVLIWWILALLLLLGAWSMYIQKDRKLEKRYGERVRAVIVPTPRPPQRETAVAERIPPPAAPAQRPEVHGDVVAGDKVTYAKGPETFVASSTGSKIHRTSCPIAERIPKNKREVYTKRDEALKAGYNACRLCKPFE